MSARTFSEKLNHLVHFDLVSTRPLSESFVTESDLTCQLNGEKTSSLFMGLYTPNQIKHALKRFEILSQIETLGCLDPTIDFEPRAIYEHRLTIRDPDRRPDNLLGEIVVREGHFHPKTQFIEEFPVRDQDLIFIERILMQNPGAAFSGDRKRMPGQNWPGLGVGRQVMDLLRWVCRQSKKDGLLNLPEYYHNAFLYSEEFFFFDPDNQAEVMAIFRDLCALGLDLSDISFAVFFDCVLDLNRDQPYNWHAQEQICPVSDRIRGYFGGGGYEDRVSERIVQLKFGLNRKRYERKIIRRDEIEW